jgi:hypothetical protein
MMQKWIRYNWIIIAITSLLVGIYITLFESFVEGKAYLYFILAVAFGILYYFRQKKS